MSYVWQRWLARDLRAAGLKVVEVDGWQNRGRPASVGSFNPTGPTTTHHTGILTSDSDVDAGLSVLITGRSDLPGPLCHIATAYNGTIYVIAAGRANHAGAIGKSGVPGMPLGADGNALALGNEVMTNGTQPLPRIQRNAIAVANAVMLRRFDRTAGWAHRHADISGTGKWDIGQLTTSEIRADAADALGGRLTLEEDDMTPEQAQLLRTIGKDVDALQRQVAAFREADRARDVKLLQTITGMADQIADGVTTSVLADLNTGGGIEERSLRKIVRAEVIAGVRTTLGKLDEPQTPQG